MADAAPVTEKKKRASSGPRTPRKLFAVLNVSDAGAPVILSASYNAAKLIPIFTKNPGSTFAEVSPEK